MPVRTAGPRFFLLVLLIFVLPPVPFCPRVVLLDFVVPIAARSSLRIHFALFFLFFSYPQCNHSSPPFLSLLPPLYTLSTYSFVLPVSIAFLLSMTFVSSFSTCSSFIRRIGYIVTSLLRRNFNYRNGVSVYRFDCHAYYSQYPFFAFFAFFNGFFSSLFSQDHGAVSQISFSRFL